jgi:hypothetical protein
VDSEEAIQLKILQSLVALVTTTNIHGKDLAYVSIDGCYKLTAAQVLRMCFRLQASNKHPSVSNTASATLRQVLNMLFERALSELNNIQGTPSKQGSEESGATPENHPAPSTLMPAASDAYLLLQVSSIFDRL